MTAAEIVSNACKQAGLVEDGTTTSIVSTLGIGSLSIGGGITAASSSRICATGAVSRRSSSTRRRRRRSTPARSRCAGST